MWKDNSVQRWHLGPDWSPFGRFREILEELEGQGKSTGFGASLVYPSICSTVSLEPGVCWAFCGSRQTTSRANAAAALLGVPGWLRTHT